MDMTQLIERCNATIREQAEEIGKLKAERDRVKLERDALLAERQLFIEDHEYTIEFEPDMSLEH